MAVVEVEAHQFVEVKANQLIFYVRGFLSSKIHFSEVEILLWDIFEEWTLIHPNDEEPCEDKERVFWHLINQLKFWSEDKLSNDLFLRSELTSCVDYLDGDACCPIDCVGVRPH